jgi:hypothetical protein
MMNEMTILEFIIYMIALCIIVDWLKNNTCLFGHWEVSWYKTIQAACSQHSFADGVCCSKCKKVLYIYDENDRLIPAEKYNQDSA